MSKKPPLSTRRPTKPIDEAKARALEELAESIDKQPPGKTTVKAAKEAKQLASDASSKPGIVERKGYPKADGTRTKARTLRRTLVYLDPEVVRAVQMEKVDTGETMSNIINRILASHYSA